MKNCIRIGYGKIARIHEAELKTHGIETIGVVEVNPQRLSEIRQAGLRAFATIEEAVAQKPDFYDICTPTHARVTILSELSALDPEAHILIEKPICDFRDVDTVRDILNRHKGRVTVNENYASSTVTDHVKQAISSLGISVDRVIIESTKHRGLDFLNGRYVDSRLGALGYEGCHLLALLGELGEGYEMDLFLDSDIDSIEMVAPTHSGQSNACLSHQGGAFMQFRAKNGCIVDLYTSMSGIIGFPCPPYAKPDHRILGTDSITRYRILRLDGADHQGVRYQIVGFFEPVPNLERSQAVLIIFKDWVLVYESQPFYDNTMSQHLLRAVKYFSGSEPNPYAFERGLNDIIRLHAWSQTCWHDTADSNDYLGRIEIAEARRLDAKRFKLKPS